MSQWSTSGACLLAAAIVAGCVLSGRAITTPSMDFSPRVTVVQADAKQFQASLEWQEVTPNNDVYMSIAMDLGHGQPCNSGYIGAQFRSGGYNTLLWSMSGHMEGRVIPVGKYCHYDCFDCSPPNKRDFQCKRDDYELKPGVLYTFTMQMEMQNASGAMWSVTVKDPTAADKGHEVEVGKVFFKDSELGLPADNCRRLGLSTYAFQEYFTGGDFTTKAAWSAMTLSGVMQPEDTKGYCDESNIADFTELSLVECKNKCAADEACHFASYSAVDHSYAKVDGSHCILYDACRAKSTYLADIWWTYSKHDLPSVAFTGFQPQCGHFLDETSKTTRTEMAAVVQNPAGQAEFEFQAGPDIKCASAVALASAVNAENLVDPIVETPSPALRGSTGAASTSPVPVEVEAFFP